MKVYFYQDKMGRTIGSCCRDRIEQHAMQNHCLDIKECDIADFHGRLI